MIPLHDRRKMIERFNSELSIEQQCKLLSIHRSGVYYKPCKASNDDLLIMKAMDEMYYEDPTRGSRRYSSDLSLKGYTIGRDKARSLMRMMCLSVLYCKPRCKN